MTLTLAYSIFQCVCFTQLQRGFIGYFPNAMQTGLDLALHWIITQTYIIAAYRTKQILYPRNFLTNREAVDAKHA